MSRSGQTAMRHARRILETWAKREGGVVQYAGKQLVRIPDGEGGVRIIARSEDLFGGCFDAALIRPPEPTLLVQVTTQDHEGGGAVSYRKRKIRDLFLARLRTDPIEQVELWAWVARRHMRRWRWNGEAWAELEPLRPLGRKAA